jgi:nucleotide-binding universal stress UspA family protein
MMATQILVPLDGSDLAEQALSCATMLARGLPTELVLFRAVSLPSDVKDILAEVDLEVDVPLGQLEAEAQSYLGKMASQLEEVGVRAQPVVRRGPAARAIVDYAEQTNMWQIVMATHGHSGITHWVHGSVADRVLRAGHVPVLLVRAR